MRNPIERHLSEFFYSGIDARFRLNITLLENNTTYINEIAKLINETLPVWMEENHAYPVVKKVKKRNKGRKIEKERLFGRYYTDNFQLR